MPKHNHRSFRHFHFDSAELSAFTRNGATQVDVTGALATQELGGLIK